MPRPVHFEFTVNDPDRAAAFFRDTVGWRIEKWDNPQQDYWLLTTGSEDSPGINGGMSRRSEQSPPGTTVTLDVPSVDETIAKVAAAGGTVILPKMAVPGVGWLAYFTDPDGNAFGLMQADESAA